MEKNNFFLVAFLLTANLVGESLCFSGEPCSTCETDSDCIPYIGYCAKNFVPAPSSPPEEQPGGVRALPDWSPYMMQRSALPPPPPLSSSKCFVEAIFGIDANLPEKHLTCQVRQIPILVSFGVLVFAFTLLLCCCCQCLCCGCRSRQPKSPNYRSRSDVVMVRA